MDRKRKLDLGDLSRSKKEKTELNRWTGKPFSDRYYEILETRQKLPVYQFKDDLLIAVKENQFVVVEGETGSGAYDLVSNGK
jgi:pre-mRNA-splicing factor ATP-dependent RNA helicase DHX15/PRP43